MKKLVLIDGNAVIHRAYHSIPKNFTNRKGEKTNALYGFAMTLVKVLEDLKPEYLATSFDLAGPTFRHKEYKEYKATRVKADQDLYDQIPLIKEMVKNIGIPIYEKEEYEADDVLGTITTKMEKEKIQTFVVSGDKDIFQLIGANVKVYNLRKGLSQSAIVDKEYVEKEYNLQPEDFIDLKALAGDSSDNIPGVPGIGQVTATKLLQKFDTLENLYEAIEKETGSKLDDFKPRIINLLKEHKEQAFLSQKLATICKKVPIDFSLEDCLFGEYDKDKLKEVFEELGFVSLLRRFGRGKTEEIKNIRTKEQGKNDKNDQLKLL